MKSGDITVGEQFTWEFRNSNHQFRAVVTNIRSGRQEGLSSESEDYAALWIEARSLDSESPFQTMTIMVGTDQKSYIDGKEVMINTFEQSV